MAEILKNLCGKTRPVNDPYEIYTAGAFEWRVLKKWQSPAKEASNRYARWFCAVKGPGTYDGYDMGDTYVSEIKGYGTKMPDNDVAAYCAANPWRQY